MKNKLMRNGDKLRCVESLQSSVSSIEVGKIYTAAGDLFQHRDIDYIELVETGRCYPADHFNRILSGEIGEKP